MKKIKIDNGSAFLSPMLTMLVLFFMTAVTDSFAQVPDTFTVIHSRKSVRNFTGQAVSKEVLDKILRAGMAAPTAVNKQPWSFVVVTDRKTLDDLKDGLPHTKMLDKAGAALVFCAIPEKAYEKKVEFAVIDDTCAGEKIFCWLLKPWDWVLFGLLPIHTMIEWIL